MIDLKLLQFSILIEKKSDKIKVENNIFCDLYIVHLWKSKEIFNVK